MPVPSARYRATSARVGSEGVTMSSLLAQIFARAGNRLHPTAMGFDTGHEPCHSSKSGRCVGLNATTDRWYCRSCHQSGGVVEALMALEGLSRAEAEAQAQAVGAATAKPS